LDTLRYLLRPVESDAEPAAEAAVFESCLLVRAYGAAYVVPTDVDPKILFLPTSDCLMRLAHTVVSNDGEILKHPKGVPTATAYRIENRRSRSARSAPTTLAGVVRFLFGLLDDIDTADDVARDDDALYRCAVKRLQARRWETGITTDGYALDLSGIGANEAEVEAQKEQTP
jgi:hypothetical protein